MSETPAPLVEGEDFYWDGKYMVFTREFLLKRGYCCQSGCRHCPYGFVRPDSAAESSKG